MNSKNIITVALATLIGHFSFGQIAPSWTEFVEKQSEGEVATLPDYSYAGYHFSEEPIPDVSSWTQFDITDYGAIADDEFYDDAAIQETIDAAEASDGPAVVFFPSGRFKVSDDNNTSKWIQVSRDSIVFKGSGSGTGGTELFMDKMRVKNGHWQFAFKPETTSILTTTALKEPAFRGDFSVFVETAAGLVVGQTIHIYHKSEEFALSHFGDLELSDDWTRLFGSGGGMAVYEPHIITHISGDIVTFKNPLQIDMPELSRTFVIRELTTIREVGVEDILFTSDWENYGEVFVHHKDDIHDYAWNALQFENVRNGWIRNCEFRSWNQAINVTQSIGVTIQDVLLSGEKGHASISTRRGYGLLVQDCEDVANQHHGPGTGYQGVNTVYLRYKMQKDQSVDCHSGQPYATLIDDVDGGDFDQNGGPIESYPHHGRHLTFWNFRHSSTASKTYNFWPTGRNGFTYAHPLFVGFQSDTDVIFLNEGLNELEQQMVEPRSLFEAQLDLRMLASSQNPIVYFVTPGNNEEYIIGSDVVVEVDASDPDGSVVSVELYLDGLLVREDTEAPYSWGGGALDTELNNMDAGVYELMAVVLDDSDNTTSSSIDIVLGSLPEVSFASPSNNVIIEEGQPLRVEGQATDSDGNVIAVSLYLDDDLLGTLSEEPYIWGDDENLDPVLFNLASGTYELRMEAVDNDGLKSEEIQTVIVNAFPTLSFSTPNSDQAFDFGANVPITVLAEDSDGQIEKVDLFINDVFHREDLSAPFEWGLRIDADPQLFNLTDGDYVFKATAYDNQGSSKSASVQVSVEPEVIPPPLNIREDSGSMQAYPNPFRSQFSIKEEIGQLAEIQLFNIEGQALPVALRVENSAGYTAFYADKLDAGMYFLHFKLGSEIKIIRLIKQ